MSTADMRPDAGEIYRRYVTAVVLHGLATADASGLNATDLYALSTLDMAGSLTSGELAERTGLTTGATTRLIDRLERRGHVRRVPDPADRRKVIIEPAGRPEGMDEVVDPARQKIAAVLGGYSPEQLKTLFDYFTRAAEAYRESTAEIRGRQNGSS
ncbi:MarR family winged helix-turn-helix transcriptional regulator [Streptosporangium sp. NPDC000396]|uniref:MarR family winged helix-turn-helix transcriptional regulator n=1 Tax=Streptosporangium sp. NPDC000396 TaxID=3366185 RepID=UPI00367D04C6